MNVKHYFLVIAFLFISMSSLFAVPAVPWLVEKTQPDGTKISVYLKGDEKVHWMESADGYTLLYDAQKYVVYARQDEQGNLTPSTIKFGGTEKPSADIQKGLHYSPSQINTMMSIWKMTDDAQVQRASTGTIKALCILAAFQDRSFIKTQTDFDMLMNQIGYTAGGAKGSVRDYYNENSYGLMTLVVTVVGPVTLPQNLSYYATSSRYRTFALDAINAADPIVDYSQFATGNQVGNLHIIFAGFGDEAVQNGQQIWSHESSLTTPVERDGVQLYSYSCSPELRGNNGTNITYIGVICHEMGHVFGSADFYDVSANANTGPDFFGTGTWDIMAAGSWNDNGRQPACHNPYNKIQWGWIVPQVLSSSATITAMPASDTNPVIYKVMANSSDAECYLLDNKQKIGFDTSLPGHGLLIWHQAKTVASYAPNDNPPLQFYPIWANSTYSVPNNTPASYGATTSMGGMNTNGCPFPGISGKTAFTDTSTPMAFSWLTMSGIGKPITNITENNANHTISFDFMGGGPDAVDNVNANVNLSIYPNPVAAGEPFTVKTDYQGRVITIFTVEGKLVNKMISQGTETSVTVSYPGIYVIAVDNQHSKLIVK